MNIKNLKVACYLYNQFTDYDQNYLRFSNKYSLLDLGKDEHVIDLIKWLRSWGCRQFKNDSEDISIYSIKEWYKANFSKIPRNNIHLIDYELDKENEIIIHIFDDLSNRLASNKNNKSKTIKVRVGPVGAAKILFALRPNLFSPWDTLIYKSLKLEGSGSGYIMYLGEIQQNLKYLRSESEKYNIDWKNIFTYLNKRHNSYPKLIDEYFWVTITKGCDTSIIEKIFNNETA